MQIIVDKLLTNYTSSGKGRIVIIIHGWGDNSASFKRLQTDLASGYHVITIDIPGFGKSQPPATAWGLSEFSTFLAHFIKKLGYESIFAFIGHSNGGAILIRGMANNDLSADKLVLLSCAGIRQSKNSRRQLLKVITKTGKILTLPLPQSVKSRLQRKLYTVAKSDMLVVESMKESFKKIVTDDVQLDATKIKVPTLLIYGEEDDQTPLSYAQQFKELIPDSSLEVLSGAGHFVQLDRPNEVKRAIESFLK